MDNFNFLVIELLAQQRAQERMNDPTPAMPDDLDVNEGRGLRKALASRLVRLGLRLDPAAGEGLGNLDLAAAGQGGSRPR